MPSFVARVERPDRGGEWVDVPAARARRPRDRWVARLGLDREPAATARRRARRCACSTSTATRSALLAALLFEAAGVDEETRAPAPGRARRRRARARCSRDLVGERAQPPPPPRPRASRRCATASRSSRDYGAFRDLQRHRLLTVQWQRLTPAPRRRRARGGRRRRRAATTTAARSRSRAPSRSAWPPTAASARRLYALCLGYRIRYVLDLNAREAMQLIELRSGREGHPELPRRRARDAPPDRRGAPRRRGGDDARRHDRRAAPGAHPQRDAHGAAAGGRARRLTQAGRTGRSPPPAPEAVTQVARRSDHRMDVQKTAQTVATRGSSSDEWRSGTLVHRQLDEHLAPDAPAALVCCVPDRARCGPDPRRGGRRGDAQRPPAHGHGLADRAPRRRPGGGEVLRARTRPPSGPRAGPPLPPSGPRRHTPRRGGGSRPTVSARRSCA